ncbi:hypothetical protein BC826DRAFT_979704 [Russula brevipes]|nr:hypothetical protein BC826DRAFT_979704 [Russula brevipes]
MRPALSVVLFFLPWVSALQLTISQNATSGAPATVSWITASGDPPTFSLELLNEVFHNSFAIGNNIPSNAGQLTVTLPIVPAGDGYTLEAVQISDINQVVGTSSPFYIAPTNTTSSSAASSGTATGSAGSSSTGTPVSTTSSSSTSTSSLSVSPTSFNGSGANGAYMNGRNIGSLVAAVVGVVVGVAFV